MRKIILAIFLIFIACIGGMYFFLLDKPFTPIQITNESTPPLVEIIFNKSETEGDVFHLFVENATSKDVIFSNPHLSHIFSHCYGGENISCYLLKEPQTMIVKGFKITFNKNNYTINNIKNNPEYSSTVIRANHTIDWGGQIIYWEKPFEGK